MRQLVVGLVIAAMLAGCSLLPGGVKEPQVTLRNIGLRDATLLSQDFVLDLKVDNPNDFDLDVLGSDVEISLNGESVARGLSNQALRVPQYGSTTMQVVASTRMLTAIRQLLVGTMQQQQIDYEVDGHLRVKNSFLGRPIPFHHSGEVDLESLVMGR
ncbi:MAG TPA: LEA type 2 family protein [Methylococcaceae bacterium]|nr:LEA type 2 family protein [Methylococcaceae bacterium]